MEKTPLLTKLERTKSTILYLAANELPALRGVLSRGKSLASTTC